MPREWTGSRHTGTCLPPYKSVEIKYAHMIAKGSAASRSRRSAKIVHPVICMLSLVFCRFRIFLSYKFFCHSRVSNKRRTSFLKVFFDPTDVIYTPRLFIFIYRFGNINISLNLNDHSFRLSSSSSGLVSQFPVSFCLACCGGILWILKMPRGKWLFSFWKTCPHERPW